MRALLSPQQTKRVSAGVNTCETESFGGYLNASVGGPVNDRVSKLTYWCIGMQSTDDIVKTSVIFDPYAKYTVNVSQR